MFDIGWMEMLVIAVVAILVIGPKDLPKVLHTVGQWMARARSVARSFQDQMEEMARQSGVDEVRKEISNSIQGLDPAARLKQAIDPTGEMDAQMKAMTDVGSLNEGSLDPAAAQLAPKTVEEVAVANADAEAGIEPPPPNPRALPDDLIAEDKKPESPLEPGATSYKGPSP
jgi:sec-independent protein translocase protein TatB